MKLLLFNDGIEDFKATAWPYEARYKDQHRKICVVAAEVPEDVRRLLDCWFLMGSAPVLKKGTEPG